MHNELVRDWMTRQVITVNPDTTLPEAHRLMTEHKIRRLPVVDGGRVAGMITRGDVRGAEASDAGPLSGWELPQLLARVRVREIMSKDPITILPDATIGDAARLMLDRRISGLPVVDTEGRLQGIITESDIFRLIVRAWE